jgi:NAD(P)-dependent dehydrogenase (short-subunit alcohol dehydrogenase family)
MAAQAFNELFPDLFPPGVVLVIGGSGGIGRVVCQEFARAGANVALTYRSRREVADEVVAGITALGRRASAHALEIGDADQVAQLLASVERDYGRIHTIVVGAGSFTDQVYVANIAPEQWRRVIDHDLNGFFNVVKAALPRFRAAGGGSFVHLGSAADQRWANRDVLSVAPKAAIEALLRGIAKEEGRYNIRANSVLIGVIEAGMFLELQRQGVFDQKWIDACYRMQGLKRLGKPEEIGYAAVFLASAHAAYITGQQISVSGGYSL